MFSRSSLKRSELSGLYVILGMFLASLIASLAIAGAPFAYPLDDAYIHLSIGRTLAQFGVWGIQPSDPAAASSSPLWSLLLMTATLAWPTKYEHYLVYVPLGLNILFGGLLLLVWDRILRAGLTESPVRSRSRSLALGILWFAVPLTPLALLGMEHVLHLLLTTLLLWVSASQLARGREAASIVRATNLPLIGLLSVLAVADRYETLFLILPLGLMAIIRRQFATAVGLSLGALPVAVFGAYWSLHGGTFLPNPLMVKGISPVEAQSSAAVVRHFLYTLQQNFQHKAADIVIWGTFLAAVLPARLAWVSGKTCWQPALIMTAAVFTACLIQFCVASVGWLYRYEAWLVGLEFLSVFLLIAPGSIAQQSISRQPPRGAGFLTITVLLLLLAAPRAILDDCGTVLAMDDRRLEHFVPRPLSVGVLP